MRGKANLINVQHDPYATQSNLVCLVETNILAETDVEWQGKICLSHDSTGQGNGVCAFSNDTMGSDDQCGKMVVLITVLQ